MEFLEDVTTEDVTYQVYGNKVLIDDSFSHAFGIERGHYYEVVDLKVIAAYNDFGESLSLLTTKELIYDLTKLLEDKFNES